MNNILGFSRETLIAVITNIEGREHLRRQRINSRSPLENPRASSTDDVECFFSMMSFFSMMRDTIGQNFTTNLECERSRLNFPNKLIPISLFTIIYQVILDNMKVHTQTLIITTSQVTQGASHPRRKEYRGGSN